jgi:hypothetical protein
MKNLLATLTLLSSAVATSLGLGLTDPTWLAGIHGKSLRFSSTTYTAWDSEASSYVWSDSVRNSVAQSVASVSNNQSNRFSVQFWIRRPVQGQYNWLQIAVGEYSSAPGKFWMVTFRDSGVNTFNLGFYDDIIFNKVQSLPVEASNLSFDANWHHVAVERATWVDEYDELQIAGVLYWDGVSVGSWTAILAGEPNFMDAPKLTVGSIPPNPDAAGLMWLQDNSTGYELSAIKADIDELKVSTTNYFSGSSFTPSRSLSPARPEDVYYFKFDETSGNIVTNYGTGPNLAVSNGVQRVDGVYP